MLPSCPCLQGVPQISASPIPLRKALGTPSLTTGRKAETHAPIPARFPFYIYVVRGVRSSDHPCVRLGNLGQPLGNNFSGCLTCQHLPSQPYPCSRPWQKSPTWFRPSGHFRVPLKHRRSSTSGHQTHSPETLKVPPSLYSSFFQLDFLFT